MSSAILAVLVVGLPLYAVAAITPDMRYTGCLKLSDGSLYGIAEGSQPATDCKKDQQITLTDYDPAALDAEYVNEADHTGAAHDGLTIDADTLDGLDSSGLAPADHEHPALSLDDLGGTPCNQDSAYRGTLQVQYAEPSGAVSFVCAPDDLPTRSFTVQLTGGGVGSVALETYAPTVSGFEPSGSCEPVVGGSCTFVVPASTTTVRVSAAASSGSAMVGWNGIADCEWDPPPSSWPDFGDPYAGIVDDCSFDPFEQDLAVRFEPTVAVTVTAEAEGATGCFPWGCGDQKAVGFVGFYPRLSGASGVGVSGMDASETVTVEVPKAFPVGFYAVPDGRFNETTFVGWSGDVIGTDHRIIINTEQPLSVTARFKAVPTDG